MSCSSCAAGKAPRSCRPRASSRTVTTSSQLTAQSWSRTLAGPTATSGERLGTVVGQRGRVEIHSPGARRVLRDPTTSTPLLSGRGSATAASARWPAAAVRVPEHACATTALPAGGVSFGTSRSRKPTSSQRGPSPGNPSAVQRLGGVSQRLSRGSCRLWPCAGPQFLMMLHGLRWSRSCRPRTAALGARTAITGRWSRGPSTATARAFRSATCRRSSGRGRQCGSGTAATALTTPGTGC